MRDGLPVSEDCAIDFHRRTLRAIESAAASPPRDFGNNTSRVNPPAGWLVK
jgi:hypothetical protein